MPPAKSNNKPSSPSPEDGLDAGNSYEITDHDLMFDCPHCGWNFVIDQQAAGRAFPCPKCEQEIEIPPLDVLEKEAAEATTNDQEEPAINGADGRVLQLQHELDRAHEEIFTLKTEIDELRFRRRYLEKDKADNARMIEDVNEQVLIMKASLDQIVESLRVCEKNVRDTQEIG